MHSVKPKGNWYHAHHDYKLIIINRPLSPISLIGLNIQLAQKTNYFNYDDVGEV